MLRCNKGLISRAFALGRISVVVFVVFMIEVTSATSGGRGGYNTTFDPNSYGGGWSCLRSLASGTCGGATAAYYDAVCDGATDDASAWNSWIAASVSANPTTAKLYIPPGSRCVISNTAFYLTGGNCCDSTAAGIKNVVIWGYGATLLNKATDFNQYFIGGQAFYTDTTHHALIATANPGDTAVTVTDGNVGRFSVGDWVTIDALSLQPNSGPPNLQFFDYRLITAINGTAVILNAPLTNTYKSNFPSFDNAPPAGPAMLHKMQPQWNQNIQVYGLHFGSIVASTSVAGRNIVLHGTSFASNPSIVVTGPSISIADNVFILNSFSARPEIDKVVTNAVFSGNGADGLLIASSDVTSLTIQNYRFTGSALFPMNGTVNNTTMSNVRFGGTPTIAIVAGAGYGANSTLLLENVAFSTGDWQKVSVTAATVSYSSGTFLVALGSSDALRSIAVPGRKMFFADGADAHCNPDVYFTISDVRTDGSNFLVDTNNWFSGGSPIATPAVLPTPCSGGAATKYFGYPANSIIQRFSGPADLTQYAAP